MCVRWSRVFPSSSKRAVLSLISVLFKTNQRFEVSLFTCFSDGKICACCIQKENTTYLPHYQIKENKRFFLQWFFSFKGYWETTSFWPKSMMRLLMERLDQLHCKSVSVLVHFSSLRNHKILESLPITLGPRFGRPWHCLECWPSV